MALIKDGVKLMTGQTTESFFLISVFGLSSLPNFRSEKNANIIRSKAAQNVGGYIEILNESIMIKID